MDDLEKVLARIRKGQIPPCTLLFGDEEYLLQNALDKIIDLIIPPADRDLNLFAVDGGSEDIDKLCESLLTVPLIPGRKLIVVRNTRIFHSRKTLPAVIQKIREQVKTNPAKAAAEFMLFLSMVGWTLDDVKDDGWRKISDEQWRETVETEETLDREAWMPDMTAYCVAHRLEAGRAGDNTERLEILIKKGIPEGNHLILTTDTLDKRKKIFKTLSEAGPVLQFSRLKGEVRQKGLLIETARGLLAAKGKKMAPGAWVALGKKTGFNLRNSMASLEKLITYAGEKTVIDEGDIEAVIGKTREETVFNLTAALVGKKLPDSLVILGDLLDQGDHPLMILSMFAREIRLLLQAKLLMESGLLTAYKPGMDYGRFQTSVYPVIKTQLAQAAPHPYVAYQALNNAGRFPRKALIRHLDALVDMDLALKSTAKDARMLLERFLMQVCG